MPNRGYGASAGATPAGDNDHHRSRPPARRRSAEPARLLGEDTLARCRRVLGPDHPTTLNAATGLTLALVQLGETEPARTLGEDTLRRSRRTLGADHPIVMYLTQVAGIGGRQ